MIFPHPLCGTTLGNLIYLYKNNKLSPRYLHRSLYIAAACTFSTPLRLLESMLYDSKINSISVKSPVFIIGYWRSGTTLLHEIFSRDPQFCYISSLQAFNPYRAVQQNAILQMLKRVIDIKKLQIKRPGDEMLVGPESPQEDEFALANMTSFTINNALYFPDNFDSFLKYVTFSELTTSEIEFWKNQLMFLYKQTSFLNENRTIVSKNPTYTCKIKYLLELFPEAKFIHIYRNPYIVYLSTIKMFKGLIKDLTLQNIPTAEVLEEKIFNLYCQVMKLNFEQQNLIPKENYTEIKFEDFEKNPLSGIEKVYIDLGINGFIQTKDNFKRYLDSVKKHRKANYTIPSALTDKIYSRLAFAIDKWGYKPEDQ